MIPCGCVCTANQSLQLHCNQPAANLSDRLFVPLRRSSTRCLDGCHNTARKLAQRVVVFAAQAARRHCYVIEQSIEACFLGRIAVVHRLEWQALCASVRVSKQCIEARARDAEQHLQAEQLPTTQRR